MSYPWQPFGANVTPQFVWNLNGDLTLFAPEPPGGFDGMILSNPALSGPGPFDGTRFVEETSVLTRCQIMLRVPATVLGTTFVELYRIRGGVVTSLAVVGLASAAPDAFAEAELSIFTSPNLQLGDMLFVALDGLGAPAGTQDLTISLWVRP